MSKFGDCMPGAPNIHRNCIGRLNKLVWDAKKKSMVPLETEYVYCDCPCHAKANLRGTARRTETAIVDENRL